MPGLLACPFCRALFRQDEARSQCPDCGLWLVAAERLPPSVEVLAEQELEEDALAPEDRPLSRRARAGACWPLVAVALLALVAFVAPWVKLTAPHVEALSGWVLARRGSLWLWGGAAAWVALPPLVWSRTTVRELRNARVVAASLAAMTGVEVAVLVALPPRGHPLVPYEYHWAWGLYTSGLASALGIVTGLQFLPFLLL
ncbi:MAG TPA: hypothetical protein PLU22_15125, partial [Polyangiaceae bacterium]|nr:hypothetical protein [Polyangiaceae bacterium]